jgi:hypothetical protein
VRSLENQITSPRHIHPESHHADLLVPHHHLLELFRPPVHSVYPFTHHPYCDCSSQSCPLLLVAAVDLVIPSSNLLGILALIASLLLVFVVLQLPLRMMRMQLAAAAEKPC